MMIYHLTLVKLIVLSAFDRINRTKMLIQYFVRLLPPRFIGLTD